MTTARRRAWNSTLPVRTAGLSRTPWTPQPGQPWSSLSRQTGLRARAPGTGNVVALQRKRQARDTGPSAAVRRLVLERDGFACVCCGVSVIGRPYSLQHRKRRSQGGDNSPANLIVVLGTGTTGCHERIDSRRDPHDEAKGYTVRSWDDPAEIPVMVFSQGGSGCSIWLSEDGRYSTAPPEGVA